MVLSIPTRCYNKRGLEIKIKYRYKSLKTSKKKKKKQCQSISKLKNIYNRISKNILCLKMYNLCVQIKKKNNTFKIFLHFAI